MIFYLLISHSLWEHPTRDTVKDKTKSWCSISEAIYDKKESFVFYENRFEQSAYKSLFINSPVELYAIPLPSKEWASHTAT